MTWLMILILVLIVVVAIAAIPIFKVNREEYQRTGKHPKGHYIGLGMAAGIAIGMPLGIATDNIALGPALGLPIGVALGAAWEKKHEDELRPRTEQEEKLQRFVIAGLAALLVAGVGVFFVVTLLATR
jgi:O-antigen ligase